MRSSLTRLGTQMGKTAKNLSAGPRRTSTSAVTLVIYEWYESQPGTLAWVFPSLAAALRAVRAMRNAVHWLIVKGRRVEGGEVEIDVDALRRDGRVLMERAA
jgi:hypothetical protein